RIRNVQKVRSGLGGVLHMAAAGAAKVQAGTPQVLFRDLNADISATGISAQGKKLGDVTFKANSNAGRVDLALNSNGAGASINGKGNGQLSGDYPVEAQLNFGNLTWTGLQPLMSGTGGAPAFNVVTAGQVTLSGPVMKTEQLRGSLRIPN